LDKTDQIKMIRMASQSIDMPEKRAVLYPLFLWGMYLAGVACGLLIAVIIG